MFKQFLIALKQNVREEDNLSTRDKWPVPKVSSVRRFYCITISIVSNHSDTRSWRTILDSISTLTADWFNLGIALGLFSDTLREIESNHRGEARSCLTEMVIVWLQMKDNSQPSWQSLASALSSPSVNRIEIATMIATEHPHIS